MLADRWGGALSTLALHEARFQISRTAVDICPSLLAVAPCSNWIVNSVSLVHPLLVFLGKGCFFKKKSHELFCVVCIQNEDWCVLPTYTIDVAT